MRHCSPPRTRDRRLGDPGIGEEAGSKWAAPNFCPPCRHSGADMITWRARRDRRPVSFGSARHSARQALAVPSARQFTGRHGGSGGRCLQILNPPGAVVPSDGERALKHPSQPAGDQACHVTGKPRRPRKAQPAISMGSRASICKPDNCSNASGKATLATIARAAHVPAQK